MGQLRRLTWTRARWRACLCGFTYYLCAVIVLENILAVVYWNGSYVDVAVNDGYRQNDVVLAERSMRLEAAPTENRSRVADPRTAPVSLRVHRDSDAILMRTILRRNDLEPSTTSTPSGTAPRTDAVPASKLERSSTSASVPSAREPLTKKRELTLEEQEKQFYRMRETKVNPYLFNIVLRPKVMCDASTFMVILVHSHHPNVDRRAAIRSTWGSVVLNGTWPHLPTISEKIKLVFVFGTHKEAGLNDQVREEWQQFDDVVQGDFFDSYQNMTLKSLLGLKLVFERCRGAKFLFKNDDDMFVNVPHLVNVLRNKTGLRRAIMGPLNVGSKVYRNGKWKVSRQEFPFNFYPPYESGAAYMITCDIVRELYETSEYVPSIFIDDVYITGILGRILNVTHEHQHGFAYWTNRPPTACDVVENKIISGTKMTPTLLKSTWAEIVEGPTCRSNPFLKTSPSPDTPKQQQQLSQQQQSVQNPTQQQQQQH